MWDRDRKQRCREGKRIAIASQCKVKGLVLKIHSYCYFTTPAAAAASIVVVIVVVIVVDVVVVAMHACLLCGFCFRM